VTAEAAGSGGNHLGRVTISRNRSDKILHKRPGGHGLGELGIALGGGGNPQRQGDPAAEPLAFLEEFVAAEVGARQPRRRFMRSRWRWKREC
jgi:hypothetical protein